MPYADPEKQRAWNAAYARRKYQNDPLHREIEAERKADWLRTPKGKASNAEATKRYKAARKAKTACAKPAAKASLRD